MTRLVAFFRANPDWSDLFAILAAGWLIAVVVGAYMAVSL